jgi:uncharacterized membrane protein
MEVVVLVLAIVFIVVLRNAILSHTQTIQKLSGKIDHLTTELEELKTVLKEERTTISSIVQPKPVKEELKPEPVPVKPADSIPSPTAKPLPSHLKEVPAPHYEPMHVVEEPSWFQKWLRNNPDLEKFIGENLVNKIGIAIFVLGIAFFVKYAIDKNWINEVGRVSIGLVVGLILVGLAHYLRKSYHAFSSVLAGGGLAVFYFTIAFAFHQYALLSQTAAFVIMVVITGFAVGLALLYDRLELSVIAAVGGFLTPFLVSSGEGNYIILFTYLLILNTGLLTLAYFKRWPLLNSISFFFTELIFAGWLIKTLWETAPHVSYPLVLLFATSFYLLFLAMNTIYQLKNRQAFKVFDFSILLLLNASYFAAGLFILNEVENGRYHGLFTLSAGIINLALAWYFFKRQNADRNFLYLLIGLTLTFLSLTIPVQLHGHAITLFWSAEFVLLFWLYQRSRIVLFYYSSLLVMVLTLISLLMDWGGAALGTSSQLVLIYTNVKGLVTNIVAVLAFAAYGFLLQGEEERLPFIQKEVIRPAAWVISIVVAFLTSVYGVNLVFSHYDTYEVPNVYHRIITQAFVAAAIIWLSKSRRLSHSWPIIGVSTLYLVYHLFSFPLIAGMRNGVLTSKYSSIHIVFHLLSDATAIALFYQGIKAMQKTPVRLIPEARLAWVLSILAVFFWSQELEHLSVWIGYRQDNIPYIEDQYGKALLTIVWALCSFALMWLGMSYKNKTLRIISLSLFSLALLKLFIFDLAGISEGGKILAFILLGALLLTISFMYQKLKKMIISDGNE